MPTIPSTGYTIAGAATATTQPLTVSNSQASLSSDYVPIYSTALAATVAVNISNLLGISSQAVGISDAQVIGNKTFSNTNSYAAKGNAFTLQDQSDTTKQAQFVVSSVGVGQTRLFTLPNYNATLATIAGTETLTNKTLTSPVINTPNIQNPSALAVDTITGYAVSTTGTIFGMSVTTGLLASAAILGKVNTAALQDASVTPNKLATGGTSVKVATAETTTSTSYTDLATAGPAVTVTIGSNGLALVLVNSQVSNNNASGFASMSFAVSGASTQAAADEYALLIGSQVTMRSSSSFLLTGLTPGSTTFTAKYAALVAGTSTFVNRKITVIPL